MPRVKLFLDEIGADRLPPVCMVCGDTATGEVRKQFAWHPPWVWIFIFCGLLPFAVLALILTKRESIYAPMCSEHRSHWSYRNWLIWLSLIPVALVVFGAFMYSTSVEKGPNRSMGGLACAGSAALGLVWLVSVMVIQSTAIRCVEITNNSITLNRVSQAFLDALENDQPNLPPKEIDDKDFPENPRKTDASDRIRRRGEDPDAIQEKK